MRDILDWVQTRPQGEDQSQGDRTATTAAEAARALEIATAPTAPSSPTSVRSPLSRLLADTPTRTNSPIAVDSAIHQTPTATSSTSSEFALPSLQQRLGVNYAELPSFLMSMVDFNGQDSSTGGAGGSASGGASGSRLFRFNRQRQASGSGVRQRNQEYNHNHFALDDDWNQLPSSRVGDMNSFNNDDLQFTSFSPMHQHHHNHSHHQHSHFNHHLQFHHQLQQHDAAARFAARALGPFSMLHRAPPSDPPQEIDLTVSSSESSDDDDDDVSVTSSQATTVMLRGSDFEDSRGGEDGDEVEILQTRTAVAATGGGSGSPSARYLTYTSLPPLRRKRRRQENEGGAAATTDDPAVNSEMFDGQRAESTNVSMENNETIERFKKSLKCSICLDVIEEMTSTICGHIYCGKCIRLAIRVTAKCPLCQRKLRPKDVHPLYF